MDMMTIALIGGVIMFCASGVFIIVGILLESVIGKRATTLVNVGATMGWVSMMILMVLGLLLT